MSQDTTQLMAFRATTALMEAVDRQARSEGISRSDVLRRAAMRDLARQQQASTSEQNSGS